MMMRRVWRWGRRVLGVLVVLVLAVVAIVVVASSTMMNARYDFGVARIALPTDEASLARGKHLADGVTGCANCHGADYGGGMVIDGGAVFAQLPAPNLTRGRGGIAAAYSDVDWVRSLRHGINPHGRPLILMPSADFAHLTADDLAAVIAYVKTRPPVDREWPAPTIGPIGRVVLILNNKQFLPVRAIDHTQPIPTAPPADLVATGQQLATISGCRGCHSPDFSGGSGPSPGGANLTPTGIGTWSEADFVSAVRTGVAPHARQLDPVMPRFGHTDAELHALWTYLRTLPPKGKKTARQQQ
jgi:mono/diheme cytochrome c family protein